MFDPNPGFSPLVGLRCNLIDNDDSHLNSRRMAEDDLDGPAAGDPGQTAGGGALVPRGPPQVGHGI